MSIAILALSASNVYAHGVWVAKRHDKVHIVYGEGASDNAYPPAKVKRVRGFGVGGGAVDVAAQPMVDHVQLAPAADAAIIAVNFDNGYWSKDAEGKSINKPMNEVPGATGGNLVLKYNVTYLDAKAHPREIEGLDIQIVPSVNPAGLGMGDKLEVLVLRDGKPLADAPVIIDVVNDPETTINTGADGKAVLTIRNDGLNVIGVEIGFPMEEKSDKATGYSYFSSLAFVSTAK